MYKAISIAPTTPQNPVFPREPLASHNQKEPTKRKSWLEMALSRVLGHLKKVSLCTLHHCTMVHSEDLSLFFNTAFKAYPGEGEKIGWVAEHIFIV